MPARDAGSRYDVLIAGGGLVGATLAAALAPLGLRIAVIEMHPPRSAAAPSYDDRATALADGSRRILQGIGLWERIAPGATPIRRIHVSQRGHFGATRLAAADHGVEALGYVVENRALGEVLWPALARQPLLELLAPARVVAARSDEGGAEIEIETGGARRHLSGNLLVIADGARSAVREMLGIEAGQSSYAQSAVTANVTPRDFHDHVAYERFTDSGPLALLPMSNGRVNVVWTLWSDTAGEIAALDDARFLARLQQQFGYRLGPLMRTGSRGLYPLSLVTTARPVAARCALVGNAARALHPVAGQGLNLALRDVAVLAELLAQSSHGDPGAAPLLADYADWRRADEQRILRLTDGLVRVFTNPLAPLSAARSLGLIALEIFPPGKEAFARLAMGLSGRVPRLARGLPLRAAGP